MACGAEEIKKTIEDHLGIKDGGKFGRSTFIVVTQRSRVLCHYSETTADGLFTLREVECLGACSNAPMVQMNDDFYEMLTPKTTVELLELCKQGKPPPMGLWGSLPMNGQLSCEGPMGKTTLHEITGPTVREGGFKGEVDPATVKAHMRY